MQECFNLFKQTANNEIFKTTPIFLLFNKKDLFEEKIRTESINICEEFADYTGNIISLKWKLRNHNKKNYSK